MTEDTKTDQETINQEQPAHDETLDELSGSSDEATADVASALQAELEQTKAKAEENWNLYLGAKAETDNVRKRTEKDVANAKLYSLEKFVNELLPVRDSLEMGLKAAEGEAEAEKLREGVDMTLKMLDKAMSKFGVEEIQSMGQKLNPELHEAVTMVPNSDAEANTVVDVVQKGYTLNNRLVRPAMVVVAK